MYNIAQLTQAHEEAKASGDKAAIYAARQRLINALDAHEAAQRGAGQEEIWAIANRRIAAYDEPGVFENFASGLGAGYVGALETGAIGATSLMGEESETAARTAIKGAADEFRPEGGDQDSWLYKIGSGLGSVAGYATVPAAVAVAAPATPVWATAGIGALGGIAMGRGEASERARAFGDQRLAEAQARGASERELAQIRAENIEQRETATNWGGAVGSLDAIPMTRMFKFLEVPALRKYLAPEEIKGWHDRLRNAAGTGATEAPQEMASELLQNLIAKGYNPEQEAFDGTGEAGALGFAVGALFGLRGNGPQVRTDPVTGEKVPLDEAKQREADAAAFAEAADPATTEPTDPSTTEPEAGTKAQGDEDKVSVEEADSSEPSGKKEQAGSAYGQLLPEQKAIVDEQVANIEASDTKPLTEEEKASLREQLAADQSKKQPVSEMPENEGIGGLSPYGVDPMSAQEQADLQWKRADTQRQIDRVLDEMALVSDAAKGNPNPERMRGLQVELEGLEHRRDMLSKGERAPTYTDPDGQLDMFGPNPVEDTRHAVDKLPPPPADIPVDLSAPPTQSDLFSQPRRGIAALSEAEGRAQETAQETARAKAEREAMMAPRREALAAQQQRNAERKGNQGIAALTGAEKRADRLRQNRAALAEEQAFNARFNELENAGAFSDFMQEQQQRDAAEAAAMDAREVEKARVLADKNRMADNQFDAAMRELDARSPKQVRDDVINDVIADAANAFAAIPDLKTQKSKLEALQGQVESTLRELGHANPTVSQSTIRTRLKKAGGLDSGSGRGKAIGAGQVGDVGAAAKKPEVKKPEAKKPEAKKPEVKKPEAKKPEAKKPEAKKPEAKKPEAKKPEAKKPTNRAEALAEYLTPERLAKNKSKDLPTFKNMYKAKLKGLGIEAKRLSGQENAALKDAWHNKMAPAKQNAFIDKKDEGTAPSKATSAASEAFNATVEAFAGKPNLNPDEVIFRLEEERSQRGIHAPVPKGMLADLDKALSGGTPSDKGGAKEPGKKPETTPSEKGKGKGKGSTGTWTEAAEAAELARFYGLPNPEQYNTITSVEAAFAAQSEMYGDFDHDDIPLRKNPTADMATALDTTAADKVKGGDLRGALLAAADSLNNRRLKNTARKLADKLGDTKVELVPGLKDKFDRDAHGLFDPETNTIKLNADDTLTGHALLHEVTHALTSHSLAQKNLPTTKQLTKLFEAVKDRLGTAYGAQDIDEFVAEAMSNLQFQNTLAQLRIDGSKLTAWEKFVNAVGNIVRRALGQKTKPLTTALDQADTLITDILSPAPGQRFANEMLLGKDADNTALRAAQQLFGLGGGIHRKDRGPAHERILDGVYNFMTKTTPQAVKHLVLKATGSLALSDVARRAGFGDLMYRIHKAMEGQRGAMNESDADVEHVAKIAEHWANRDDVKEAGLRDVLDRLIYDAEIGSTINQVDPTLTEAEAKKRYADDPERMEIWKKQRPLWEQIGSDGQKVYTEMRDLYRSQFSKIRESIEGHLEALGLSKENREKLQKNLYDKLFQTEKLDVYFPLVRSGDYRLSYMLDTGKPTRQGAKKRAADAKKGAYDDAGVENKPANTDQAADPFVFEMFETAAARDAAAAELAKRGDVVASSIKTYDSDAALNMFADAPPTTFVHQVVNSLRSKDVPEDTVNDIMDLFVSSMPETSMARALRGRQNTPGFVADSLYALQTKGYDIGRQVVRMQYSGILSTMKSEVKELERALSEGSIKPLVTGNEYYDKVTDKLRMPQTKILAEMQSRIDFAMNGAKNKWAERNLVKPANQMAFLSTIGLNVASAAVNMSQIPLFVYPMLGGRYGYTESMAALNRARRLVFQSSHGHDADSVVGKGLAKISLAYGVDSYYNIDNRKGTIEVRKDMGLSKEQLAELEHFLPVVKEARDRGQLNKSFLLDALSLEEGGRDSALGSFARVLDRVTAASAVMFNQAERFNRQVTIMAAYDLEIARLKKDNPGMSDAEARAKAAESALDTAQETNGGSVMETAPALTQQGLGRVALMYKAYGLQMVYSMLKSARHATRSHFAARVEADPANKAQYELEAKIAMKQVAGFMASSTLLSGVYGMPLYGAIQLMYDNFFKEDDEDDFNTVMKNATGGGWLYRGGLEAITGLSTADRVGLSNLLVQMDRFNTDPSAEETVLHHLGGPAWSVLKSYMRAADDFAEGNERSTQRGLETLLPGALGHFMKAARVSEEGYKTRRGDSVLEAVSSPEVFGQAMGFTPAAYTQQQETNMRLKGISIYLNKKRTDLLKRLYVSRRHGDHVDYRDTMKKIREFNRRNPKFRIDSKSIRDSMKSHAETSAKNMFHGVMLDKRMQEQIHSGVRTFSVENPWDY